MSFTEILNKRRPDLLFKQKGLLCFKAAWDSKSRLTKVPQKKKGKKKEKSELYFLETLSVLLEEEATGISSVEGK